MASTSLSVSCQDSALQVLHGVKVLWDWNIISVDESWTLQHVFENLEVGSDGHDEGDLSACALCTHPMGAVSPNYSTVRAGEGLHVSAFLISSEL